MSEKEKQLASQNGRADEQKSAPPDSTDPTVRDTPSDSSPESTTPDANLPPSEGADDPDQPPCDPKQKVELDLDGLGKENPPDSETPITTVAPKVKKRRPLAIILILVILLLGGFLFGYQHTKKPRIDESAAGGPSRETSSDLDAQFSPGTDDHPSYGLAPFFVPIPAEQRGREVFLKVTVSLAFRDRVPSDEMGKKSLMIRSKITDILLSKRLADLRSVEGKTVLKQEIRNVVNVRLTQGAVQTVYFEEFFLL